MSSPFLSKKVVDRMTGEIRSVRFDSDADLHYQGDGEMAWGVKFVLTAARTESINERIILDVDWVKTKGGEAKTAMSSFRNLAPSLPAAQGVIYDTALRGVHHQELLRNLGWLSVNRVQAKSLSREKGAAKRTEKMVHIEDRLIGDKTVKLFTCGGALGIATYTDTGEMNFERLKRTRTIRKQDKNGLFRWYNEYQLPESVTGAAFGLRPKTHPTNTSIRSFRYH